VQFYFGLPIAMVILCATVVPVFHRAKVFTAYEYLEQRFDSKTRALASVIFLCQRDSPPDSRSRIQQHSS
jgi:Na+/proline symporter